MPQKTGKNDVGILNNLNRPIPLEKALSLRDSVTIPPEGTPAAANLPGCR